MISNKCYEYFKDIIMNSVKKLFDEDEDEWIEGYGNYKYFDNHIINSLLMFSKILQILYLIIYIYLIEIIRRSIK